MKTVHTFRFLSTMRALAFGAAGVAAMFATPAAQAKSGTGFGGTGVVYSVPRQIVQGNMPLVTSYTLQITSPANVTAGIITQVTLNTSMLSAPAGVSSAQALSYVTITPLQTGLLQTGLIGGLLSYLVGDLPLASQIPSAAPVLTFTGPNQTLSVTVTVSIPYGNWAGSFGYEILTSGWEAGLVYEDPGAFINVTATLPVSTTSLPVISINQPVDQTVYTFASTALPVQIPYVIVGNTQDGSALTAMNATFTSYPNADGVPVTQDLGITPVGIGTANATATGCITVTGPGAYLITAYDANAGGSVYALSSFTVKVQAGPPGVAINSPDPGSAYISTGGEVDVPFTFTGVSQYGGVTQLTATLDGVPVTITPSGYGNLTATGAGTLALTTAGDHVLAVTCTDNYGTATASETVTLTIQAPQPPPTVVINTPAPNATFTYNTTGPALVVPFTFTGTSTGGNITALSATMDGNPVTFTTAGLNTLSATGSANLSFTSGGNHTLLVTATNNVGTASTSEVITIVTQTPQTNTLNVAITAPAANSTYTLPSNGSALTIADGFTSNSTAASGVTSLSVTFNGNPVAVTTSALGNPTVTANGTLVVSAPGVYTLAVTATDQNGTASTSENITVAAPTPCPQISIVKPVDGASYMVGTSTNPLWVQVSVTGNTTPGSTLQTFTLTLNGQPVTYTTLTGLNTISANGTVSLKITSTGTYTLVATTTSGGASATDTSTFKVTDCGTYSGGEGDDEGHHFGDHSDSPQQTGYEGDDEGHHYGDSVDGGYRAPGGNNDDKGFFNYQNPVPCNVNWEQSWSCNSTQKGGGSLPVCFQVQYTGSNCVNYWNSYFKNCGSDYYNDDSGARNSWGGYGYVNCLYGNVPSSSNCVNNNWDNIGGCKYSHDNTVQVVCYEVKSNGSCGTPTVYTCSSKTNTCRINGSDQYSCNFATAKGTHTYRCDVYYTDKSSGKQCFLGTEQFCTK